MVNETQPLFSRKGHCPVCDQDVLFNAWSDHLRDSYLCETCGSIPRERALMLAIDHHFPQWRDLIIHESSPANRGVSEKLRSQCRQYISTQFSPKVPGGMAHPTEHWRCENIEKQEFSSAIFDLVITQDVFEHIFDPASASREINRTLKLGGAHIWTTPLVFGNAPTRRLATIDDAGCITHLQTPEYHKNPVDPEGSLVTFWYGFDLMDLVDRSTRFSSKLITAQNENYGIIGPLTEVIVSKKY